jgi:hypothetical protein
VEEVLHGVNPFCDDSAGGGESSCCIGSFNGVAFARAAVDANAFADADAYAALFVTAVGAFAAAVMHRGRVTLTNIRVCFTSVTSTSTNHSLVGTGRGLQ